MDRRQFMQAVTGTTTLSPWALALIKPKMSEDDIFEKYMGTLEPWNATVEIGSDNDYEYVLDITPEGCVGEKYTAKLNPQDQTVDIYVEKIDEP